MNTFSPDQVKRRIPMKLQLVTLSALLLGVASFSAVRGFPSSLLFSVGSKISISELYGLAPISFRSFAFNHHLYYRNVPPLADPSCSKREVLRLLQLWQLPLEPLLKLWYRSRSPRTSSPLIGACLSTTNKMRPRFGRTWSLRLDWEKEQRGWRTTERT